MVRVRDQRLEWDERRAAANLRKHGVGFEEARTVFDDENALCIPDPEHSADEDRFVLLGLSIRLDADTISTSRGSRVSSRCRTRRR